MIFLLQILVNLWLGTKAITVSKTYGSIFAISGIVYIWITLNANIAAGIERLKIPFIFLSLGALLNVPLAYLFTLKTNSWISIMLANIISMIPYSIIQPIVLDKWLHLKIRGQINEDVL